MKKDYIIGVDCGTTAVKEIVWDKEGNSVAEGRKVMQLLSPKPGWGEQRCEEWWSATVEAIKKAVLQVDPRRIVAIGITHQRESFVLLNKNMYPLRNAILWVDTRATSQVQKLRETYGDKIHKITGLFPNVYTSNAKMMWVRENEPSIFEQTYKILDVYAYLAWKLTGQLITTWASACPLGLFDISKLCWSKEVIKIIGVREEQFPELCPPGEVVGTLTRKAASLLGLPEGVPVVGGGGDGQCAALGAGVAEEGYVSLNLGTAICSEFFSPEYVIGHTFRTLCGCVPGTYIAENLIPGGAFTINWFIKEFGYNEKKLAEIDNISAEEILDFLASSIKPEGPRLLLVPYWKAVAAPFWDHLARGVVIGWSADTGRVHLYRAILEGIAFEQKFLYNGMETSLNKKIEKIIILGGGAKSTLWQQILADVTGIPVFTPHTFEATCLGAAMLAAYAAGMYKTIQQASKKMSRFKDKVYPDEKRKQFYMKIYDKVYRHLFPKIQELVDEFTKITLEP